MTTGTPARPSARASNASDDLTAYIEYLSGLLGAPATVARASDLADALDGGVSRRLRRSVPLEVRRATGAFFTSRSLADRLVAGDAAEIAASEVIVDTACGAGDLLLSAARALPVGRTVPETLRTWGGRIVARDLDATHVRLTRLRLALLASCLVGESWAADEEALAELLPRVTVGDGTLVDLPANSFVVLNPPFGATVGRESWGSGRISRAAVFTSRLLERLPDDARVRAVLPDVLRSGTNYGSWRRFVEERLQIDRVSIAGRFDAWTDIDVFLLSGRRGGGGIRAPWWPVAEHGGNAPVLGDHFAVRVGPVVPHRDPVAGPLSPYLQARDLPRDGEHKPGGVVRRHLGTRFHTPLVVVSRTCRPLAGRQRLAATIVIGHEPVLVENHLLVCVPRDGEVRSCQRLVVALADSRSSKWLDERLRCRHLTVAALRAVPLPDWVTAS